MKSLIAGLSLALTLLTPPVFADHRQQSVEQIVANQGCTAEVTTSDYHGVEESFYRPEQHRLYIGTDGKMPDNFTLLIILHEIGHCHQFQEMTMPEQLSVYRENKYRELDADKRGAQMACLLGMDAPKVMRDLMKYAKEKWDYDGDQNHGSSDERIAAAASAPACGRNDIQLRFA